MRIASLHRYPVKGLSPEVLSSAALVAGGYFPGDRLYAIENGPSGFDPAAPERQQKIKYLMLMKNAALACLKTRYDDAAHVLTIEHEGEIVAQGDLASAKGRRTIEKFFERLMPGELRGPPKILAAPEGFRFTDSKRGFVSLINLASLSAIEGMVGAPVDPRRFRANIYIEGAPAWSELDLVDHVLGIGERVKLKILARTDRCAATTVDPDSSERDLMIPRALMKALGHVDCGVYAEVLAGGAIAPGDSVRILRGPSKESSLPLAG